MGISDVDLLVIQPIHHELFHPFQRIIELDFSGVSPDLAFLHLFCDELECARLRLDIRSVRVLDLTFRKS